MTPFDLVKQLNMKTDDEWHEAEYVPFVINRAMSNTEDSLVLAEVMNLYSFLDKDIQYDFYFHGLPKGKRYGKWHKRDTKNDELISIVSEVFEVNSKVAAKFLSLMDDETREKLIKIRGGK